jgi:hypothetical protein
MTAQKWSFHCIYNSTSLERKVAGSREKFEAFQSVQARELLVT